MKSILPVFILMFAWTGATAQPPDTLWTSEIPPPSGGWHMTSTGCGCVSPSGNIFVAGQAIHYAWPSPTYRGWAGQLSADGDILWSIVYGQMGIVKSIACLPDSAALILGSSSSTGGWLLARLESDGSAAWTRDYSAITGSSGGGTARIVVTSDGQFVLAGSIYSPTRALLMKVDNAGDTLWTHTYGDTASLHVFAARQAPDGGFLVGGNLILPGGDSAFVTRTDASANALWTHLFRGGFTGPSVYDLVVTSDGNAVATGKEEQGFLAKLTADAGVLWYHGNQGQFTRGLSMVAATDGGVIVLSFNIYADYLTQYTGAGSVRWTMGLGWEGSARFKALTVTPNREYVLFGVTDSFAFVAKTAPDPSLLNAHENAPTPENYAISVYPNPFNPSTRISLSLQHAATTTVSVCDLMGRHVATLHDGPLEPGKHKFTFDGSNLPSGIYFARVQAGEFVKTQKLLLLK